MTSGMKLPLLVALASLLVAQAFADLNSAKREAIKAVDGQVANIKKLTEETSAEVDKRSGNIKIITKHEREYGEGIFRDLRFELAMTAKSAYMMANLLGCANDVFRCIEYREREAQEDAEKYYNQRFLDAGRDREMKAEQYQRDLIKAWKDDYYKAVDQYSKIYDRAVSDIQRATSESALTPIVRQFEKTTNQMADIVVNVLPGLNKAHIQVLKVFNGLVYGIYHYSKERVSSTSDAIEKCFPKTLVEEEIF